MTLFSKNLGPTAQRIAQKKLLRLGMPNDDPSLCIPTSLSCSLAPKSRAQEVSSSLWLRSNDKLDTVQVTSKPQNLWDRPPRRPVVLGCTSSKLYSSLIDARKKATSVYQRLSLSRDFALVTRNTGQKSTHTQPPVIHPGENARFQSGMSTCKSKNQLRTSETTSTVHQTDSVDTGKGKSVPILSSFGPTKNTGSLQNTSLVRSQAGPVHAGLSHLEPPTSQFKFDLPYLKMKLEQMKSVEQGRLACNSGSTIPGNLLTNENIYQSYIDHEERYTGFDGYSA